MTIEPTTQGGLLRKTITVASLYAKNRDGVWRSKKYTFSLFDENSSFHFPSILSNLGIKNELLETMKKLNNLNSKTVDSLCCCFWLSVLFWVTIFVLIFYLMLISKLPVFALPIFIMSSCLFYQMYWQCCANRVHINYVVAKRKKILREEFNLKRKYPLYFPIYILPKIF